MTMHRSALAQLTLPQFPRYSVAQDGRGKFRVYDGSEMAWADAPEDANDTREEAERRATIFQSIDEYLQRVGLPWAARVLVQWDEADPRWSPERCGECEGLLEDGQYATYVVQDADPGNPEVGPQPNICDVPLHTARCLPRYLVRTGLAVERVVSDNPF